MDRFAADPHWHGFIVAYFFLGGIAAGAYAMATLASLVGDEEVRRGVRAADYIAFPLVGLCGLLLIVDLNRPGRFWHMMIQSQTYRPMFKWWSPMSAGSWGLSAFGAFSFLSFVGVVVEDGWVGRGDWTARVVGLRRGVLGRIFAMGGAASGFFLGAYTGTLLSATNQPIWAETTWIAPLFLASAASTGLAALVLLTHWRLRDVPASVVARLEWADTWAIGLEAIVLLIFAASLASDGLAGSALIRWPGLLIPAVVVPVGLVLPLVVRRAWGDAGASISAGLVLVGGLALRAAVVGMPASLLKGYWA